jgi:fibronectin type 3 domain-containing protein
MKRLVVIIAVSFVLVNLLAVFLPQTIGMDTTPSWTSSGDDQASAEFGYSVASAGDVNGDGYSDVIVGARYYNTANSNAGKAYLYLGSSSGLQASPSWNSSGDDQAGARFGYSVASAGDVNGDSYDDVIIGAYGYSASRGKAYLYLGSSSGLEASPSWTSSGDDQAGAYFGYSVANAGDVNGDGYSDVIIGAKYYDTANTDAGKAYLYLSNSSGLQASPSWTSNGDNDQANANFGNSVASAGDVNGDGYSDVIIGAKYYDTANSNAGKAYLYFGIPSSSGLQASPSWTSSGDDQAGAEFGNSVASAGDVNNDSYADVIVGAHSYDIVGGGEGKAYVYLGSTSGLTPSWNSSGDGDQGGACFGHSVASAGDLNGDGYDDVIIGAYWYNTAGVPKTGKAYLYIGSSSGLQTSPSWTSSGDDQAGACFGNSVASAGDLNGDGYSDVMIGAYGYDTANSNAGKAYLYSDIDITPPAAPIGLTAADHPNDGGGAIDLNWDNNTEPDLDHYSVCRSTTSGGPYTWLAGTAVSEYTDSTTTDGITYYYVVTAGDEVPNESGYSNEASASSSDNLAPPATPTGLTVTDVPNDEGGALNITWNANTEPDLDHYTLYSNKTGSWAVVAEILAGTEYYVDTGLTDGTRYYYNISASDDVPNESLQSATANGVPADNLPPVAPTGLTAADHPGDEGGAIDLNWNDNTETDLDHYDVYRSTTSGGPYTWLAETAVSEYTDSTTTDGITYYYVVTASDEVPNESEYSDEANASSSEDIPPANPTGLTAADHPNDEGGAIDLNWNDNTETDLDHYDVYRSTTSGGPYTWLAETAVSEYTDSTTTDGTTYYYVVTASDEIPNESGYSNEANASSSDNLAPTAPTGLAVTDVPNDEGGALNITWNANTEPDLDHYTLYSNKTGSWAVVAEILAGTEYYVDTGLTDGTRYYYNISASDDASTESPQSATVSGVPADNLPPAAPSGLAASDHPNDEGGAIDLNWNDNTETDLDHYDVYRSTTMGGTYTWLAETTLSEYTDSTTTDGITYYYVVTASDAVPNESGYSAEANASSINNLPQGTISGVVEDEDGNPIEGATVTIYESGTTTDPVGSTITDSNGAYSVDVAPGTYDVKIEMSGYDVQWETDVVVTVDQTTTTDLILPLILIPTTDILGDYWWLILIVIIVIIIIVALIVKKKKPVEVEEEEKPVEATEEEE